MQNPLPFIITFVYGLNTSVERRSLWEDLVKISGLIGDVPWTVCGDFNVFLHLEEATGGNAHWTSGNSEFKDCILHLGLTDLRSVGPVHMVG